MSMRLIGFLFLLLPVLVNGSNLKGHVKGDDGVGLPFATLYIEGTTIGTTTNSQGKYLLEVPQGEHTIVYKYVGYRTVREQVIISSDTVELNIVMLPETVELKEVVIKADENPAEKVIREAIKKRRYYLNQVEAYSCDVYIKGLQTLERRPDKIFGLTVTVDTGIVYLSESVSKFNFERPDKIKEVMISSKVSGYNSAFSFNQASEMRGKPL